MIKIENLAKQYNKKKLYDCDKLLIQNGDFINLTGNSGSGKSTFLHLLAGYETFDSGQITYTDDTKSIELITQRNYFVDNFTVKENILLAFPKLKSKFFLKLNEDIMIYADKLHIKHLLNKTMQYLSTGEIQRVCLIRSIMKRPTYLFCDEVTANLNEEAELSVYELLKHINQQGTTIIVVNHNNMENKHANRTFLIDDYRIKELL